MPANDDAEAVRVNEAGFKALGTVLPSDAPATTKGLRPGLLAYIPLLVCGTCGRQGMLDPVRY